MDLKQIQELIRFVAKSGVTEVKLEQGDFKITIKTQDEAKAAMHAMPSYPAGMMQAPMHIPSPVVHAPATAPITEAPKAASAEQKAPAAEEAGKNLLTIKSPMIGTFYRKPSPDKDTFVKVGDKVQKGQVVCIIEAMKLFNEIESEVSGTIVKILADDMSPVEYDQPLFLVEP